MCISYDDHKLGAIMRTNIDIDDVLLDAAMTAAGLATKRDTVRAGIAKSCREIPAEKCDRARIGWEGDFNERRHDRSEDTK
ncbi:type II toxin-antitoxin system VapB family antitoxin [Rhizobium leguminosarum]|uniref:type II toxin-antitoxin system VapB family antitoxin n=1 Tax=Rhizobium leguminosarum TaxID=384 RepID=UPI0028F3F097|nr:type II toxin-antitoxin system VapB family antitoxin [Rhizobium leguminosarum]